VFYLTQSGFEEIVETIKLIANLELPSTSFNSCAQKLLNSFGEKIKYTKQWYCISCKKHVILTGPKKRNCENCKTRYLQLIY
jgi:hypothetical protein